MKQPLHALFFLVSTFAPSVAISDCPVTLPSNSPVELPAPDGMGWYGSESLAVLIRSDGKWTSTRPDRNYGDKLWLWRRGFDARAETQPDLVIEGVRLDRADATQRVHVNNATNAMGQDWHRMLVGMELPSAGCWEFTARYKNVGIVHELTFVLAVGHE
jgi:hypothetical protein